MYDQSKAIGVIVRLVSGFSCFLSQLKHLSSGEKKGKGCKEIKSVDGNHTFSSKTL